MYKFLNENYNQLLLKIFEHFYLAMTSLILGIIIAVPIGIIITKSKKISKIILGVVSIFQTIPTFALFAIMIPIFGVGKKSAIIALLIYSLLPIIRNTYLGLENVPYEVIDIARSMGMTNIQILLKVKIPLAIHTIIGGIRLSSIYIIAWTTLASYIGAGGLGDFIFTGLQNYIPNMIISGTIPIVLMAFLVDYILDKTEKILSPFELKDKIYKE